MSVAEAAPTASAVRSSSLDRLRGLAIACMVVDHLTLVLHGPEVLRVTVGRLAMPIFFVLAGHLVTRLTARHYQVAFIGALLPVVVPWVDSPNVLLVYAVGSLLLVTCDRFGVPPWLLVVLSLAFAANGHRLGWDRSYDVLALVALMASGRYVPRRHLDRAGCFLPGWLALPGRYPLTVYVGHLLLLQGLALIGALPLLRAA